ncbi:MAG: DUF1508 domain-containing protein [Halovenus sp.]
MAHCSFEVYEDDTGEYRWRFESGSEVVGHSGDAYDSESEAKEAVELLREEAPDAGVSDDEEPYFELYEDEGDEWRWRMVASNGQTITGERSTRLGVERTIQTIKTSAGRADVTAG